LLLPSSFIFSFPCYGAHLDLHSFPTRRSSDLSHSSASIPSAGRWLPNVTAAPTYPEQCVMLPTMPGGHNGSRRGPEGIATGAVVDRKSTRLNSSHVAISYAVFCLKKKKTKTKK